MLENIRIVMVHTSHSGNIGAAARAMKNMSISQLYLVSPSDFPSVESSVRASHAVDIVNEAVVTETLEEAIADCELVIGTSARERTLNWEVDLPDAMAINVLDVAADAPVAIVFGRERTGLTNEELALCHRLVHIPTNPDYSSLNVAAAIQVICYEIYRQTVKAQLAGQSTNSKKTLAEDRPATAGQINAYHQHLCEYMDELDFLRAPNSDMVRQRLMMFFNRAKPTRRELNILHGLLTATRKKIT